jgi:hypothetical protein
MLYPRRKAEFFLGDAMVATALLRMATMSAALILTASAALAQGSGPDRISARMVAAELKTMGLNAEIGTDDDGAPKVSTMVDEFKWVIFFYNCDTGGDVAERPCNSLQYFSGYTLEKPLAPQTLNKWNTDNRYARGYVYATKEGGNSARIELDALFAGTSADPARMFRAHFDTMKVLTAEFRKAIGYKK